MALTPEQMAKLRSDPKFADFTSVVESMIDEKMLARETTRKSKKTSSPEVTPADDTPQVSDSQDGFFDTLFGGLFGTKK